MLNKVEVVGSSADENDKLIVLLEFIVVFWILVLLVSCGSTVNFEVWGVFGSPYPSEQEPFSANPDEPISLIS